jgi:hypothetical protein
MLYSLGGPKLKRKWAVAVQKASITTVPCITHHPSQKLLCITIGSQQHDQVRQKFEARKGRTETTHPDLTRTFYKQERTCITQTMECSLLYTYLTNQSSNLPPDRSCTFSGQGEECVPDVLCVLKIAANRVDIPVSLGVVLLRMSLIKVKVSRHIFCAAHANVQTVAH